MTTSRRPRRVAHLVRSLDVGGLERVVCMLARARAGRDIVVCIDHVGAYGSDLAAGQIRDLRARRYERAVAGIDLPAFWRLLRLLRRERVDVLHSHNMVPHHFAALASVLTGVPNIHTRHGRAAPDNPKVVRINRWRARASRAVVAVSEDIRRVLTEIERVPAAKVTVICNGIDTAAYRPAMAAEKVAARRHLGIPETAFTIGNVGRLAKVKDHATLLHAFKLMAEEHVAVFLVLVGEGPERTRLERVIDDLDLGDRVLLAGAQRNVCEWYHAMDCFALSSLSEGTSMALLEAGACGLPAVVTDVGGNRDVVGGGESGFLVPAGDQELLGKALIELAGDGGRQAAMGAAARQRVQQQYSFAETLFRYEQLYARVTGN